MSGFSFDRVAFDLMTSEEKLKFIKAINPINLYDISKMSKEYEDIIRQVYPEEVVYGIEVPEDINDFCMDLYYTKKRTYYVGYSPNKEFFLKNHTLDVIHEKFKMMVIVNVVAKQQITDTIEFDLQSMNINVVKIHNFFSEETKKFKLKVHRCFIHGCSDACIVGERWSKNMNVNFLKCKMDESYDFTKYTETKSIDCINFISCSFSENFHMDPKMVGVSFETCDLDEEKLENIFKGVVIKNLLDVVECPNIKDMSVFERITYLQTACITCVVVNGALGFSYEPEFEYL